VARTGVLRSLLLVLSKCPLYMLSHDWRSAVPARLQSRDHSFGSSGIAERHCDVAQPLLIADAANGAAFGPGFPCLLVPVEQLGEIGRIKVMARRKVLLAASHRELVPGTYELAVITA